MINNLVNTLVEESQKTQKRIEHIFKIQRKLIKAEVGITPYEVLGTFGRCRLLYFKPTLETGKRPIFIVPSIINKYYILDLMKGMSFVEYLVNQNTPVYLIDWGAPRAQDRFATLEDHILHWLDWAISESLKHAKTEQIDLFGQCVGGTFAMIYTAIHSKKVRSLITLTAPVNFHDSGLLSTWANLSHLDLNELALQWGNIYQGFLKESFSLLKPLDKIRKYKNFVQNAWNTKFLDRYLAINQWVDDCISFPGMSYVKYIQDFYQKNLLYRGELMLGDEKVDLTKIKCPLLVISSKEDHIVPFESARVLLDLVSSDKKELKVITGGHIGIVISSKAKENFWSPVEGWVNR